MPKGHYTRVPGSRPPKPKDEATKLMLALQLLSDIENDGALGLDIMHKHGQAIRTMLRFNGFIRNRKMAKRKYTPIRHGLPVIFRIMHADVDVLIALFPTAAVIDDNHICAVFQPQNPHSMGNCDWLMQNSWPATPRAIKKLRAGLVEVGYTNLREAKKISTSHLRARYIAVSEKRYHVPPKKLQEIVLAQKAEEAMHGAQGSHAADAEVGGTGLATDNGEVDLDMQDTQGSHVDSALHDESESGDNVSSTTEGES